MAILVSVWSCKPSTTTTVEEEIIPSENPVRPVLNQELDFASITPEHIVDGTEEVKTKVNEMIEALVNVPDAERNFVNTMVALDDIDNEINTLSGMIGLMAVASPDSAIRNTALVKKNEISQLYNEITLNEDLYKAVKAYSTTEEAKKLTGWQEKFLTETVRDFERNGFALPKEDREKLKTLMDDISATSNEFNSNIAAFQDYLYLSEKDMEGMPEDYKKARLQEDGKYKIGMSYPDVFPFLKNAKSSEARKQLLFKFNNRAYPVNEEVLEKLISLRTELANLLGYETYADYQIEKGMAKTPEAVWDFLEELQVKVKPKAEADIEELKAYQVELGMGDGKTMNPWDRGYLQEQLLINKYDVDAEAVREYFPIDRVKEGLFSITQNLFGLEYKKVDDASIWQEDVEAYDVYDAKGLIGRFYLDLFPRPNKYGHAACFPIVIGKNTPKGFQRPVSSLECNFSAPTEDKPALLTHREVETFFHEFGHVLHSLLTTADLGLQSGFMVSRDFVEAPSQIFENWVWDYDALSLFAKHYETDEVLPKEMFDKMLAAKNVMSGRSAAYQIFLSTLDMTLYDGFDLEGATSIAEVRADLDKKINMVDPFEGTHMEAAFGHLVGYGAGYYSYLWSKVFAQDMFSRFETEGIMNKTTGMDYRNIILGQGATKDEMIMIEEFLGREVNQDAFLRSLGLDPDEKQEQ
ncbi:MAG: M3 family metallopeptidase [Chitinophagales bacterium]